MWYNKVVFRASTLKRFFDNRRREVETKNFVHKERRYVILRGQGGFIFMQNKIESYVSIKSEATKPEKERKKIINTNRGNLKKPRRYHMDDDHAKELRAKFKKDKIFHNPYRKGGLYYAFVQALIDLGINKDHSFKDVKHSMKSTMSSEVNGKNKNLWEVFSNRKPRNMLSGRDINGRIIENANILQRISGFHPFGEKLRQLFSAVHIYKDTSGLPKFELCTKFKDYESVKPINEMRRQKKTT